MTIQNNEKKTVSGTVCKMYVEHGTCTWGTSCKFAHPPKKACNDKQKKKSMAPNKANTNNKKKQPGDKATMQYDTQPFSSNATPGCYVESPYLHMFNTYDIVYGYVPQPYPKKITNPTEPEADEEEDQPEKLSLRAAYKLNNPSIASKFASAKANAKATAVKSATPSPVMHNEKPLIVKHAGLSAGSKLTNQELYNTIRTAATCEQAIARVSTVTDMTFVPAYYSHVLKFLTSGKNSVHTLESMWMYDLISLHVRHAVINANNLQKLVLHCVETIQSYRQLHHSDATVNATHLCHAVACIKAIGDFYGTTYQF
jgi:hypothetical protein